MIAPAPLDKAGTSHRIISPLGEPLKKDFYNVAGSSPICFF